MGREFTTEPLGSTPDAGSEPALEPGKRPRTAGMMRTSSPQREPKARSEERIRVPGGPSWPEPDVDPETLECGGGPIPIATDAVTGAHLWLDAGKFSVLKTGVKTLMAEKVGPYRAGPYFFHPTVNADDELVYYVVYHTTRRQNEWLVGPAFVDQFAAMAPFYLGVARAAYPGSQRIEGSTDDGADRAPRMPSILEIESRDERTWQERAGIDVQNPSAPGTEPMGMDRDPDVGLHSSRGAGPLMSLRNAHIRIDDYVVPARQMAQELLLLVDTGQMDPIAARQEAIEGRNRLMRVAREEMSPGGAAASRALKSDGGVSEEEMVKRKVFEGMRRYSGWDRDVPMSPEKHAIARADLDADSSAWKDSASWIDDPLSPIPEDGAGNITRRYAESHAVYRQALEDLGESTWVSREIIKASGKPNPEITALASGGSIAPTGRSAVVGFLGHNAARAGAALGVGAMAYHVITAEEGQRLHAAAQEGVSFMGGLVGAEMGQMFVASVVPWMAARAAASVNPVVMIVVSIVGGAVGGAIGGGVAPMASDEMSRVLLQGSRMAMPAHATVAGGGLGGVMDRQHRANDPNTLNSLETSIFSLDQAIVDAERQIRAAPNRTRLELLQKARISLFRQREATAELLLIAREQTP